MWLPFGLWPAQRDVLIDLEQQRLTVILKARQLGLSWLVVGWALWLMLFQPAATVLFFSKRDQEAVHLLAFRLRGMLDRLPDWLQPELVADNDHNIELANGSVGLAFPTTGGRSYTASLVVVDEADFADNLDALLAAVKPTIDAGGPADPAVNGGQGEAAERLQADLRGGEEGRERVSGDFPAVVARPGRSAAWYEEQRRDVLAARAQRTISSRSIRRRTSRRWRPAILIGALLLSGCVGAMTPRWSTVGAGSCCLESGDLAAAATWRDFVIGADPAEGNPQSDNSAGSVVDLAGAQVAAWAGRVEPATFGSQIAAVSAFFNGAAALVERNNHGHAVLLWLREFSTVQALPGLDKKPGWATTGSSKPMAYDNAADVLRAGGSVIRDPDTLGGVGQHHDRPVRAGWVAR